MTLNRVVLMRWRKLKCRKGKCTLPSCWVGIRLTSQSQRCLDVCQVAEISTELYPGSIRSLFPGHLLGRDCDESPRVSSDNNSLMCCVSLYMCLVYLWSGLIGLIYSMCCQYRNRILTSKGIRDHLFQSQLWVTLAQEVGFMAHQTLCFSVVEVSLSFIVTEQCYK